VGNSLRTLLISPFFNPSLPSGGVLYSVDLTRVWLKRGRTVAVICSSSPEHPGDLAAYVDSGQLVFYPIASRRLLRFTHHPDERLAQSARDVIGEFGPDRTDYSDETAREIDQEVRRIVGSATEKAREILTRHQKLLDRVAERLHEVELIDRDELEAMIAEYERTESPAALAPTDGEASPEDREP